MPKILQYKAHLLDIQNSYYLESPHDQAIDIHLNVTEIRINTHTQIMISVASPDRSAKANLQSLAVTN